MNARPLSLLALGAYVALAGLAAFVAPASSAVAQAPAPTSAQPGAAAAAAAAHAADPADAADAAAEQPASPRAVIEQATGDVTMVLTSSQLTSLQKRGRVDAIVHLHLDADLMSRLVLARNYRKLTPEQELEFAAHFREHLVNTYWRNASAGELVRIDVLEDREETGGDWTVKTRVVATTDDDIRVDYRLRRERDAATGENTGPWRIIDIIIESVSLISNFRSQFAEIVGNEGVDGLLAKLREKNAVARTEREEAAAEEALRRAPDGVESVQRGLEGLGALGGGSGDSGGDDGDGDAR